MFKFLAFLPVYHVHTSAPMSINLPEQDQNLKQKFLNCKWQTTCAPKCAGSGAWQTVLLLFLIVSEHQRWARSHDEKTRTATSHGSLSFARKVLCRTYARTMMIDPRLFSSSISSNLSARWNQTTQKVGEKTHSMDSSSLTETSLAGQARRQRHLALAS